MMTNKTAGWSLEMQGVLKDWPSVVDADGTLLARTYGPNAEAVARKMAAADAMLVALTKAQAWVQVYETIPGHEASAASMGRVIAAAIAAAEAAGVAA